MTVKAALLAGLLLLPALQEPSIERLVERLRSPDILERGKAELDLKLRGSEALPLIETLVRDPDPEVAARARAILEVVPRLQRLTPNLVRTVPGIREKLASNDLHAWTAAFLDAVHQSGTTRRRPGLEREDLQALAGPALRAAAPAERAAVCGAIAAWRLNSASPEFASCLEDQDWNVRNAACEAITACNARDLIPVLLERMKRDTGPGKSQWIQVLGSLGCRDIVPELSGLLLNREARVNPAELLSAILELDAVETVPALLKTLRDMGPSPDVVRCLAELAPEEILPATEAALMDEKPWARDRALAIFSYYRSNAAEPLLLRLAGDPESSRRAAALSALVHLRSLKALEALRKGLEDDSGEVRRAAAIGLASRGIRDGVPELVSMLAAPDRRAQAIFSIASIGAREAIPDLLPLLRDREACAGAAYALGRLQAREAEAEILKLVDDPDANIRVYAIAGMTGLQGKNAIPKLRLLLQDGDGNVRNNALLQLKFLDAKEAVPDILALARKNDSHARYQAVYHLAAFRAPEAIPLLLKELEAPEGWIRGAAARVLGMVQGAEAAPVLRVMLTDPDSHARHSAAVALALLGERAAVRPLLRRWDPGDSKLELNAIRKPAQWRAWQSMILAGPPINGGARDALEELARRAGVRVEIPDGAGMGWAESPRSFPVAGRDLASLLFEVVNGCPGVVLEPELIRVLSARESRRFWKGWWAAELTASGGEAEAKEGRELAEELAAADRRREEWKARRASGADVAQINQLLTPALRAWPGLVERLAKGTDEDWAKALMEIHQGKPGHPVVKSEDLDVLAVRALRAVLTPHERTQVLGIVTWKRLGSVRPQLPGLLNDSSAEVRLAAARAMLRFDDAAALPRLYPLLQDPEASVRRGVVEMLAGGGFTQAAPRILEQKDDPVIREAIALHGVDLGIPDALTKLLEVAGRPGMDHYTTRRTAILTLCRVGGPALNGKIAPLFRTEEDVNAQQFLLYAIGPWGARDAIPDLVAFFDRKHHFGTMAFPDVLRTLRQLGAREAAPTILRFLRPDTFIDEAATVAADMDLREAIPLLRKLLDGNAQQAAAAARALGSIGDHHSIPALRKLLDGPDRVACSGAARALAMLGDRDSLPSILRITRDPESFFYDITAALQALPSAETRAELLLMMKDGKVTLPASAATLFDGAVLLPLLLPHLEAPYDGTRYQALQLIGRIDGDGARDASRRMLTDSYDSNRQLAAESLCRRGEKEGVPLLLLDPDRRRSIPSFTLNGVRSPATWKLLQGKTLSKPGYASVKDHVARIAFDAGLKLEDMAAGAPEYPAWANTYVRLQEWGRPLSLLEALDRLVNSQWMVVLEPDRIRILGRTEARPFWTAWWEKEKR